MSVQQFKCIFIYFILKINMKRLEGYFRQKMKMKFLTVVFNSVGPTHTYTVGWWWSLDSLLTGSIELVCCNALWALHETVQTGRRWTSVSPDNRDWTQMSDAEVICGAIQPNQLLHLDPPLCSCGQTGSHSLFIFNITSFSMDDHVYPWTASKYYPSLE